ncbi:MAG: CvpA family protein [Clostridia bacterium]|nr:CvpA family protein [Clostridia bacterium]
MDPIKVDFSGGGSKKGKSVVIPPNKAGLKIAINLIATAIVAAIAYYFYLPAFNFQAIEMYIYFGMIILAYCAISFVTSGALASPEYSPYARKRVRIPLVIGLVLALVVGIGFVVSSVFFRAKDYHEIIAVNDKADFSEEIVEVDFSSVPLLDKESAETLATKALSDLFDQNLVSQFDVNSCETQINLNQKPVRVATLKYDNIIKWFNNRKVGLPGYLVIDMNTQKVEYKKVDGGIRYSDADHFNYLLKRHLRFKYPTRLLGDSVLEVDEQGKAWWVCPVYKNTIGLFGGRDVIGAILVDPTTGDCQEYTIEQIRDDNGSLKWLDRVYDPELLVEQYDYYGKYVGGFWNSILGQDNVVVTTDGYNYIALNDDVYMYTGVTSITAGDNSITGFTLINQRTKDAKFYRVSGATENAAQEAAQGKVQQYSYTATFPLLVNIGDEPTYFMALKDNSNIVQQYALVNVNQFTTIIATDTTIEGCRKAYIKLLKDNNIDVDPDAGQAPTEDEESKVITSAGKIAEIRTAVISGNSCYYIKLDSADTYFTVYASEFNTVVIANEGDSVEITHQESTEAIIKAESFTLK